MQQPCLQGHRFLCCWGAGTSRASHTTGPSEAPAGGGSTWLQLWGSCGGLQMVGAPQLSCFCTSWDNLRTVRGRAGNFTLCPVFMLGLRLCWVAGTSQRGCSRAVPPAVQRQQIPGSRRPEMTCCAMKALGHLLQKTPCFAWHEAFPSTAPSLSLHTAMGHGAFLLQPSSRPRK